MAAQEVRPGVGPSGPTGTLADLRLVDHHCHSVVGAPQDRAGLESLLTEGLPFPPGQSAFDTMLGLSVRRWCAPVLGLEPHCPPDAYVARRAELGHESLRLLMRASGTATLLVDGGFRGDELLADAELGELAAADVHAVVRVETAAERGLLGAAAVDAPEAIRQAVQAGADGAIGLKSVAAYRIGLELPARAPDDGEVRAAADAWLRQGTGRLDHPVLVAAAVWAGVATGLPLQFHTGFGDPDEQLVRADPALLQRFAAACGSPIVLLHCWPYHRQAAYLAHALPNVFMDLGLGLPYIGSHAPQVLGETLELVPFAKLLHSSDAFGAPELYLLGALRFRQSLAQVFGAMVDAGEMAPADLLRIAEMIGSQNAERLYGLT